MEHSEICRIKFVPIGSGEAPRFNFDSGEMMVLEEDFISYKDAHEKAKEHLNHWKQNRESVEAKLHDIAGEFDIWEQNTNITNVVGGAVGTVGGTLAAIGLIVAAPVALAGLIIGGAASVTTLVADQLKKDNIKIPRPSALADGAISSASAVGIVGHIFTLASSAEGLARGARSEYARVLREAAEKLKEGREAAMGDFLADYPI
ncbi:unnamed protein product [Heligmosomoides polygyrus]|uniref:DUF4781 domain-containing protein n=1 Tax=Heligmosomoides polygyrus TaxID=6339 RepID=A0A3P8CXM1_HELPZ|nr:unnamed protein product [Heligmosomoides polygyrus]